jgi:hypothetical protein
MPPDRVRTPEELEIELATFRSAYASADAAIASADTASSYYSAAVAAADAAVAAVTAAGAITIECIYFYLIRCILLNRT